MNFESYEIEEEIDIAVDASASPAVSSRTLPDIETQLRKQPRFGEMIIEGLLFLSGAISKNRAQDKDTFVVSVGQQDKQQNWRSRTSI
jgi:hypothetical protein